VSFLIEQAFLTPKWFVDPEILRRIEPVGVISRIGIAQNRVLTALLNSARFNRLVEQEALQETTSYAPVDLLSDVRKAYGRNWTASQCGSTRTAAVCSGRT
jgi:hypothetical protein